MDLVEALRISWRNVRGHKLRSFLTTLGVVIGVAAVITFVTLGAGLQADIVRTIAGDDAAIMYVSTATGTDAGLPDVGGGAPVFTDRDVEEIRRLPGVAAAAPQGNIPASRLAHDNESVARPRVTVTTANFFYMKGYEFRAGRPYNPGQPEVVVNEPAASRFRGNLSVGENVTLVAGPTDRQINATVVGIVREPSTGGEGAGSFLNRETRPTVYASPVPFYNNTVESPTTGERERVYGQVVVEATSASAVEPVQGRIYTYLGERSDARQVKPPGYRLEVTTYDQLVDQIEEVSSTFTAYITGIAVVSLVVGAIGIANIMLVSVAERTREIGVMKAVGAYRRDVLQLFLLESVLLGFTGAVLGAAGGALGGYLGSELIGLPLVFRVEWFVVAVVVGLLVGVVAGLYPAWSAASTDPIDALRHE